MKFALSFRRRGNELALDKPLGENKANKWPTTPTLERARCPTTWKPNAAFSARFSSTITRSTPRSKSCSTDDFFLDPHRRIFERMIDSRRDAAGDRSRHAYRRPAPPQRTRSRRRRRVSRAARGRRAAHFQRRALRPHREGEVRAAESGAPAPSPFSSRRSMPMRMPTRFSIAPNLDIFELAEDRVRIRPDRRQRTRSAKTGERALEKIFTEGRRITGLSTGYPELDNETAGLQPSELIILAARPSMGKTALALNIAENVAAADIVRQWQFSASKCRRNRCSCACSPRARTWMRTSSAPATSIATTGETSRIA